MRIIIAGAFAIGSYLAKLLSRNKQEVVLMDQDEEKLGKLAIDYDLLTMHASATSIRSLKEARVEDTDLFIAVTPDESYNMTACGLAKALGAKKTVAKIDSSEYVDPQNKELFHEMGISSIIYPEMLAARDIINGLKMSWVRQRWDVHDGALVMLGIKLREPLHEISGLDDPFHVVAIRRRGDTIIPRGSDVLKLYDLAYFMTTRNYIPYIRRVVGKEHYVDVKNVMVMGGGSTAVRAIRQMPEYMQVKVIEKSVERCEALNSKFDDDILVINGDGRDLSLLSEEGIRSTQAFVALTGKV